MEKDLDTELHRLILLTGGILPRVTTIDMDLLHSSSQGIAYTSFFWDPSLVDLHNLAALCDQYGLSVVPPSALPKAESSVLILHRDCFDGSLCRERWMRKAGQRVRSNLKIGLVSKADLETVS